MLPRMLEDLHHATYVFWHIRRAVRPASSSLSGRNGGLLARGFPLKEESEDMTTPIKTLLLTMIPLALMLVISTALAADPADKQGWGIDDPYNKLYNPREFEKIKAKVVKVMEVVPMAGMSPATAMEVQEGSSTILVHLCPTWFAKPNDIGLKPGERVVLKGCWAEINGKDVFMASKVKKGDYFEFKCRLTKDGTPFWTMTPEQLAKEQADKDD